MWWGTACKHLLNDNFLAISENMCREMRLIRTSKCKRWALSICVMPMYVHDVECVSADHVFDQTGLGNGGALSVM